ncbi:NAD-dependent deacetylase [Salinisphaera sp. PC39]|uniref:SIR2 family NAD-dependent protein deacylase n=1 Tax=Salinisphaera sp. PC39 TaxID=1304156 RepID=UPI00333E8A0C
MHQHDTLHEVAAVLREARRVLVITGAGISADSGLPTYRGVGGLYEDAATEDAVPIEEALSGPMFQRDPGLTWKYIGQIEAACRGAAPNEGHRALARMEPRFDSLRVITQNVDGFHRRAGSTDVIEMHGNIQSLYCTGCGHRETVTDFSHIEGLPPLCPDCGGVIRPDVVLFGEMLPPAAVSAYERALGDLPDAVISVGTTAVFPYIAGPIVDAARRGVPTIEINPGDSEISRLVDIRVRERAAQALPALAEML